ncbi:MAG: hypothetical protein K0R75_1740 [Paenibacillaceae bacterium]|jgi:hypothetical protein|nr:hypothetical protein [Paenibacillaceae bacterium]
MFFGLYEVDKRIDMPQENAHIYIVSDFSLSLFTMFFSGGLIPSYAKEGMLIHVYIINTTPVQKTGHGFGH